MSQQEPLMGGVQKAEAEAKEEEMPIVAIPICQINGNGSFGEPPLKKTRGKPIKYGHDANLLAPIAPIAPIILAAPVALAAPAVPTPVTLAASNAHVAVVLSAPASFVNVTVTTPNTPTVVGPTAPALVSQDALAAPATVAQVVPIVATPLAFTAPAAPATPDTPTAPTPPAAATALAAAPESVDSVKKRKGRPYGSSNKHRLKGKGPTRVSMVPHVITVKTGEDLTERLISLSFNDPRNICILSASGEVSNITLRKPDTPAGVVTYEGRFEIVTLGGSFILSEGGDEPIRHGGLNVSLSGPDGRLMGGGVAGKVVAASTVQVVVASFGGKLMPSF